MTLSLGTVSRTSADNANTPGTRHHSFLVLDWPESDQFVFSVLSNTSSDDSGSLVLADYVPFPNPDAIATGSGNLQSDIGSTIALLSTLDVSLFSNLSGGSWTAFDPSGVLQGRLGFDLTTVSPVPGPPKSPSCSAPVSS